MIRKDQYVFAFIFAALISGVQGLRQGVSIIPLSFLISFAVSATTFTIINRIKNTNMEKKK